MNLKYTFLLFLILTAESTLSAQIPPSIQWENNYGGSQKESASIIRPVSGGGYIVAGYTNSNDGDVAQNKGFLDVWVIRLDAFGNLLWEKTYGGSDEDVAYDIQQTSDGGYIVAGKTKSADGDVGNNFNPGYFDVWVVKLDAIGNLIWEKTYGGSGHEIACAIRQINGGYLVAGYSASTDGDIANGDTSNDAWILKLNMGGNLIWENTYGGSSSDFANNIQQTAIGDYIVVGHSASNDGDVSQNQGSLDYWIFKLSASGNMLWSKTHGGSDLDRIEFAMYGGFLTIGGGYGNDALVQTTDGGYIITGSTSSTNGDVASNQGNPGFDSQVWVVKVDANGTLVWEQTYGGTDFDGGTAIQKTLDGNYIVAAQTGDGGWIGGVCDYWLFKIDPTGNILWEQTYGGSAQEAATSMFQVSGCEYIMAGHATSNDGDVSQNNGNADFWIVKLQMQWPPPTVSGPQEFCWSANATLADLAVSGNGVPTGFSPTFTWYDDTIKTNVLPDTTALQNGENYYVSQTIDGCESPLAEVLVNITDPVPTAVSPQEFCEDEQAFVSDIAVTGQNLLWYQDAGAANPIPANTPLQDGQTYYVSQTLDNCESSLLPIAVEMLPPPAASPPPPVVRCDENGDGTETFYLPDLDAAITGGAANVAVSYHLSFSDAENAANPLPDTYTNAESPSQTIYARALDTATGCDSIVEVELRVSPVPEIMGLEDLIGCDDGNGEAVFDLSENNDNILGNQAPQNLKITYHEIQADADNGANAIPDPENYTSTTKTIFVRLENTQTGCFDTGSFILSVKPRPSITVVQLNEEVCSDEQGGNSATVDLSVYDTQINPNATGTQVVYFANLNAYNNGDAIANPANYTTTENPQTLIAVVMDTATGCFSATYVEITITVNDRPVVDLGAYHGRVICWDSDLSTPVQGGDYAPLVLETKLGASQYTFTWTLDGVELPETGPSLPVSEPGVYEVTVTDSDGTSTTCSSVSSATITGANPPEFVLDRLSGAIDNPHSILVSQVTGMGNYEFSLGNGHWFPLTENGSVAFEGLAPGTHIVRGRSLEGCGITVHSITLIGYPKFFTPNQDGRNDRWNIIGLENQPQAEIFIFDRYGKLLESLNPAAPGWDGTYNGRRMPSNDYWFRVNFLETLANGTERPQVFQAHFTLKR